MAERINQARRIITFLRRLFARFKSKFLKWAKKCKYKGWISFFWSSWKYERTRSGANLTWRPSGFTYFACDALRSYFHQPQKNEIYFLCNYLTYFYNKYVLPVYLGAPTNKRWDFKNNERMWRRTSCWTVLVPAYSLVWLRLLQETVRSILHQSGPV